MCSLFQKAWRLHVRHTGACHGWVGLECDSDKRTCQIRRASAVVHCLARTSAVHMRVCNPQLVMSTIATAKQHATKFCSLVFKDKCKPRQACAHSM
jgi:hypothetical protein